MSFQPPPDHTKAVLAIAIGAAAALFAFALTADRSPHVGDNIHHLPHGGFYQDGNKKIAYGGPHCAKLTTKAGHLPLLAVLLVTALIVAIERHRRSGHLCMCTHSPRRA